MPTSLDDLPRDNDGVVTGLFRIIHAVDSYTEGFGNGIVFTDGVAGPVGGQALAKLVAAMGHDFDIEPWDSPAADVASSVAEPEPAPIPEPETVEEPPVVAPEPEPPVEAEPAPEPDEEDLFAMSYKALHAMAKAKGIHVPRDWSKDDLLDALTAPDGQ